MAKNKCDVCGENAAVAVASSTLGPLAIALCERCIRLRAEPYYLLVWTYASNDKRVADWVEKLVLPGTLEVAGKTREQFELDIEAEMEKLRDQEDHH